MKKKTYVLIFFTIGSIIGLLGAIGILQDNPTLIYLQVIGNPTYALGRASIMGLNYIGNIYFEIILGVTINGIMYSTLGFGLSSPKRTYWIIGLLSIYIFSFLYLAAALAAYGA